MGIIKCHPPWWFMWMNEHTRCDYVSCRALHPYGEKTIKPYQSLIYMLVRRRWLDPWRKAWWVVRRVQYERAWCAWVGALEGDISQEGKGLGSPLAKCLFHHFLQASHTAQMAKPPQLSAGADAISQVTTVCALIMGQAHRWGSLWDYWTNDECPHFQSECLSVLMLSEAWGAWVACPVHTSMGSDGQLCTAHGLAVVVCSRQDAGSQKNAAWEGGQTYVFLA